MRTNHIISLVVLGGLFAATSCNKQSSPGENGDASESTTTSSGYVLYSDDPALPDGTVVTSTRTLDMKDSILKVRKQGRELSGTATNHDESLRIWTINSATRHTVEIKKEQTSGSIVLNGKQVPSPSKTKPLHEKTIILTKDGDVWTGKLKEGIPTDKQTTAIKKMAKTLSSPDNKYIFGTKPRHVGDTWDVDPSELSSFGADAGNLDGSFKATFDSVTTHKGLECAVVLLEVDLTGKSDSGMTMHMTEKATVHQSTKYRVGVSFNLEGKFSAEGGIKGGAGHMTMEGPMTVVAEDDIKLP